MCRALLWELYSYHLTSPLTAAGRGRSEAVRVKDEERKFREVNLPGMTTLWNTVIVTVTAEDTKGSRALKHCQKCLLGVHESLLEECLGGSGG